MRMARANDGWRKALSQNKGKFTLSKLEMVNIKGVGDKVVVFPTRFTTLCGENGAGKTTLLRTLFSSLAPKFAASHGIVLKAQNPEMPPLARAQVFVHGNVEKIIQQEKLSELFVDDGGEALVSYVDAAAASQRLLYVVKNDSDFSTALDGTPEAVDALDTLQLRKFITGRAYSNVVTNEIEDYADEPIFPYFTVTVGGLSYSSEEMGLGELCANYLVWALARLKDESILLLEEPESHLPPRAQEALMNHIADLSWRKKISVVVSTHSQHTLVNVPNSHITLLGRNVDKCVVQQNPRSAILHESLRISKAKTCLIFVEDHSAAAFLMAIIEITDLDFLESIEITWNKGWSDLDMALHHLSRRNVRKTVIVGVYDGDQRENVRKESEWPFFFLPGEGDPAEYMVQAVKYNSNKFSELINFDKDEMELVISNLAEIDVKDFFTSLQRSIGAAYDIHRLYRAASIVWMLDAKNYADASKLVESIKLKIF